MTFVWFSIFISSAFSTNRKRNLSFTQLTTAAGVNTFVHTSGQTFQITKKMIWLVSWRVLLSGSLIFISHDDDDCMCLIVTSKASSVINYTGNGSGNKARQQQPSMKLIGRSQFSISRVIGWESFLYKILHFYFHYHSLICFTTFSSTHLMFAS